METYAKCDTFGGVFDERNEGEERSRRREMHYTAERLPERTEAVDGLDGL